MSTNCFKWTRKATHFDLYCRNNSTYFVDPPILWLCLCYNCQTDENYLIDGCGILWEQSVCFISLYVFSPLICNLWSILSVVKIDMHKINSSLFLMFKGYYNEALWYMWRVFLQFREFHIYVYNEISCVLPFHPVALHILLVIPVPLHVSLLQSIKFSFPAHMCMGVGTSTGV